MAVQMQTRTRTESAERWSTALQRSIALGLEVFVVADTGERMVTSASQLDTLHRSDGDICTCKAGLSGDPVCCHRAAVRFVQGRLSDETAAPADCSSCTGCGVVVYRTFEERCLDCGGSGVRVDRRLAGEPGVVIVATAA